ncbi:MAG: DUF4352 domain-containing protein [Ktedonobacteraceae bacterium]
MVPISVKRTILYGMIVFVACFLIAACSNNTNSDSSAVTTQPTLVQGTSIPSTPGVGPTVILTPTRIPGGNEQSQLVTLPDRILTITRMSKQAGTDSNSVAINLTITIKNTGAKSIGNDAAYFQLISAEGDIFGLESKETLNFFGAIAPQSSRSGTIIFQIPAGAIHGMRLMYRPDISTETIFVPLNLA